MKTDRRTKVLFVCLGNACRSPMAEAIASKIAADVIEASSAGLTPLGRIEEMTILTLAHNGFPYFGLSSKPVVNEAVEAADMVINLSGHAKETAFADHDKVEDWYVQDPYGASGEIYQTIFEQIRWRVEELAERLRKPQRSAAAAVGIGVKSVQRR